VKLLSDYTLFPGPTFNVQANAGGFGEGGILAQLSRNWRDRQNGSKKLGLVNPVDYEISPVRAFFNCGPRGGVATTTGTDLQRYTHYSCLAGRNNFAVLFPQIGPNENSISGFGRSVEVLGGKDQNAIALFNNSFNLQGEAFVRPDSTIQGFNPLMYQAQGKVHDRIRGTHLWEVEADGFHNRSASGSTAPSLTAATSSVVITGLKVTRAAISETLALSGHTAPTGGSRVQSDLNRDGYADIAVGSAVSSSDSKASLQIFFGNAASDFAYSYALSSANPSDLGANCSLLRYSTFPEGGTSSLSSARPESVPNLTAFSTYLAKVSSKKEGDESTTADLVAEHPIVYGNSPGFFYAVYAMNNGSAASNLDYFNRPSVPASYPETPLRCKPQLRKFLYPVDNLSASDLDYDGMTDLVAGFSTENTSQGKVSVFYGAPGGAGLGNEQPLTLSEVGARLGSSLTSVNWRFIVPKVALGDLEYNEGMRRDLWVGAAGYRSGEGAIYNFSKSGLGTSQVSSSPALPAFTDSSNSPNNLNTEFSKIIGDLNGDAYDDYVVPVKRMDSTGDTYFDLLIHFGSRFGPISNSFCRQKFAEIKTQPGGSQGIATTDCLGSSSAVAAYLNDTPIRLPQYVERATGLGANSLFYSFPAGDVNQDGMDDVVFFDTNNTRIYLYFGSESGLVNGQPIPGVSSNRSPQLVTSQISIPLGSWAWQYDWQSGYYSRPIVNGDFNNDGHQDIAIGVPTLDSPRLKAGVTGGAPWVCTNGATPNTSETSYCANTPGPAFDDHGGVVVLYGGTGGYQTPDSGDLGLNLSPSCDSFGNACTYSSQPALVDVYGSLGDSGDPSAPYKLNPEVSWNSSTYGAGTACAQGTAAGMRSCSGRGSIIRNPTFYNFNRAFYSLSNMRFGASLTTGDFNDDGIVDLAVGAPDFSLVGVSSNPAAFAGKVTENLGGTTLSPDQRGKGTVFLYYGSSGGIVAPPGDYMLGDKALGLSGGLADPSRAVFQINPRSYTNAIAGTLAPELDLTATAMSCQSDDPNTVTNESTPCRKFGMSIASGDFNGDGKADLASVSLNGQLYVYYGPICQTDNAPNVLNTTAYASANRNRTRYFGATHVAADCKRLNLNQSATTLENGFAATAITNPTTKLHPQMITMNGVGTASRFGSVLMSRMPGDGGNINGDLGANGSPTQGTSDLIIGSGAMSDPDVTTSGGKVTGMSYVLFGHKYAMGQVETGSTLKTQPGLYVGSPTYNLSIVSMDDGNGGLNFQYQTVKLKPYESDGSVTGFFLTVPSMGDLNGDGTGDLLIPSTDFRLGADGQTSVISGGGFQLIY
jgi:hypothetical protein